MNSFKYRPLDGLFTIKKEEISNTDILSALPYLEEKIASVPEGRVSELVLLFYMIKIMCDAKLNFYVKGGIIQQYYLKDKARPTYDLDLIIKEDSGVFVKKLENALKSYPNLKIVNYEMMPADDRYPYDAFIIEIDILNGPEGHSKIHIDGIINPDIYDGLTPLDYKFPEIITPNATFKGVPIEHIMAEKIFVVTNDIPRPNKHLVDLYSLIHIDIDKDVLKHSLNLVLDNYYKVSRKLNRPITPYVYRIKEDKEFFGTYIFHVLQVGYTLTFYEMVESVNNWLANNL